MRFWQIAVANLRRRPLRSLLTVLGVAIAVACLVVMVGLSRGVVRAWHVNLEARGTHLLGIQKGAVDLLSTSIDAALGAKIQQVKGVESTAGAIGELLSLGDDVTVLAEGWPVGSHLWKSLQLVEGRFPEPGDRDVVMLGQSLAEGLKKHLGDEVRIGGEKVRVVGMFRTRGVMGNNLCVLPLEFAGRLQHRADKVTAFHIRVLRADEPGQLAAVQARLQTAFPELSFLPTESAAESDQALRMLRAVAWSFSLVAGVIALVVMLNTLLMSVVERTREIGVLSAVGWQRGRIMALIVCEGLILGIAGAAAGLALGVGGLTWVTSLPRVHGLVESAVDPTLLAEVGLAAVVLGVLGSIYPAWRASKLQAVRALGYE